MAVDASTCSGLHCCDLVGFVMCVRGCFSSFAVVGGNQDGRVRGC